MKKRILLFTTLAAFCYVSLTSYRKGLASHTPTGENRTGCLSTSNFCGGTAGCHGPLTGVSVLINLDSSIAGNWIPFNAPFRYKPYTPYAIQIVGTTSTRPYYGFQMCSVDSNNNSAGTFSTLSPAPANRTTIKPGGSVAPFNIIENFDTIRYNAAPGDVKIIMQWTSPGPGIGPIRVYCTLIAVNGDSSADANDISGNAMITMSEIVNVSVPSLSDKITTQAYPNPFNNSLSLKMENADAGLYTINIYGLNGATVHTQTYDINSSSFQSSINSSDWAPGFYIMHLSKDGAVRTIPLIKQ